jgi:ABC-type amino acid transport system permease subunit
MVATFYLTIILIVSAAASVLERRLRRHVG